MLNLLKLLLCQNCFSTKFRKILVTALFSEQLLVTVSKYENNSKMKNIPVPQDLTQSSHKLFEQKKLDPQNYLRLF